MSHSRARVSEAGFRVIFRLPPLMHHVSREHGARYKCVIQRSTFSLLSDSRCFHLAEDFFSLFLPFFSCTSSRLSHWRCRSIDIFHLSPLMNSMTNGKMLRLTNDVIRHMTSFFSSFQLVRLCDGSINVASFFYSPRMHDEHQFSFIIRHFLLH